MYQITLSPRFFKKKVIGILTSPSIRPSLHTGECIFVCFKIMDTSVYFNGIYSADTKAIWFVCWKLHTLVCLIFKHSGTLRVRGQSIYLSIRPSKRPSVHLSRYLLLNHWAEFYQTCYITSSHGKGVQEQHYFLCACVSIHLCVTLSPPTPLGRI